MALLGKLQVKNGFTLLEVVIVIVMVGMFIPAMFTALQTGTIQESRIRYGQQQLFLAEAAMEEIIADRNSPNRGFSYLASGRYGAFTGISGFTRQVQVNNVTIMKKPAKIVTATISRQGISSLSLAVTFIDDS